MKNFRFSLVLVTLLMVPTMLFAQKSITGVVLDASNGDPVIGASVLEIGTTNGTVTDWDGNFTLTVQSGAKLSISYMGYKTQEVDATDNLHIRLGEDTELLEEVVVVGYGVAKKNDMTGSVTAIKPDEKNKGIVTNAQDMLQGKIAGVNVTSNSGAPGGGATIRVRGGSSLNASNDPLIVIDGMAMDNQGVKGLSNPLSMVNPADIESFTVLKDASATAIYGSRGSNGVIIITTKKGAKGAKPTVSYNGNVSVATPYKLVDVMNATEYRKFVTDYYGEGSDAYKLLGNADTNWQKEIYRTAVSTDHNLTIAGGAKNMPYRVSLGYTLQNGVLKNDNPDFQRTTANVNLNPSFLDNHLTFNFNAKFMYARNNYAGTGAISNAVRMDPTQSPYSDDDKEAFNGYFAWKQDGGALNDPDYQKMQNPNSTHNPVALLKEKSDKANSYDVQGNLEADYKIHGFEDLRLHMAFSADYANGNQTTDYAPWGPSNFYYGNHSFNHEQKYNLTYNAYAQYYKDFDGPHHFDAMLGYEWSHAKYWGDSEWWGMYGAHNTGKADDGSAVAGQKYKPGSSKWAGENYLVSFMARFNYIALDRYMVSFTLREDGSSRFKKHWATFPAVALGWKMSEENWLKDVKEVDELKIRLNWGMTGQQEGIGNYNYFASYNANINNTDGRYPIPGINDENMGLLYRPDAYNENLTWETTTTYGAGIDYSFFHNRLSGSLDYYYRYTTDLLNRASVPVGSNFRNQVWSNIGSMMNQGVEFNVIGRPIQTKNWQWEVSANVAYNQNKILSLTGEGSVVKTGGISAGTGNTVQVQKVGYPMNSFYVYQQVYGEDGKPIEGVYVDRNADGKISEEDLYCYKSPVAPWVFGLSTRLQYKNWDLGIAFHANVGNYVYNDRQASYVNVEKRYDSSFGYLQNATAQSVANGWQTYDHVLSDYFVENASFLKCDNITLGYSFDKLFKNNSYKGINGRIYLTASNVFTVTKYSGVDPEIGGGIDGTIYPRPFTGLLGLSLNF